MPSSTNPSDYDDPPFCCLLQLRPCGVHWCSTVVGVLSSVCNLLLQSMDTQEWKSVLEDMDAFLNSDILMPLAKGPARLLSSFSLRCSPASPLAQIPFHSPFLRLHDAILATYYQRQVQTQCNLMPVHLCTCCMRVHRARHAVNSSMASQGLSELHAMQETWSTA